MKYFKHIFLFGLMLCSFAEAKDKPNDCQVLVLSPVHDDLNNYLKRGTIIPVDIARDGENGSLYCSHGSSCIPAKVKNKRVVKLLNCRIGSSIGDGDDKLDILKK